MNSEQDGGPRCDDGCWHYGVFGDEGGCEASGSIYHEPLEPGQRCLHPDEKTFADMEYLVEATNCLGILRVHPQKIQIQRL